MALGLGVKNRRKKSFNVATIPNCEFWVDLARTETITYAGGTNVSQVADLSGKGKHLTKTGSGNDTIYPVYQPTERGLLFLNSAFDQMVAGNIGDWNFMHNGNGCSVLLLVKIDAAHPASNGVLMSTSPEASGGYGTNLWYYNTNQQYFISTRGGTTQAFGSTGAANSLVKNTPTIISYHMEFRNGAPADLVTRYNGTTDLKLGNAAAFSGANSTATLFFGKLSSGGVAKSRFILKKCAIFSRRLSKAEENLILEDWAKSENIPITRYGEMGLAVLAGQSNAKGRGDISDTIFATTPSVSNASIFNNNTSAWSTLQAGTNNDAYTTSTLGLEMNLAKQYTTLSGKPLYLVKYAVDGTALSAWVSGGTNFTNLQAYMQRAYWNLEDSGYAVKPFFIWYQGETDAQDNITGTAYGTNLQTFLNGILLTTGYTQAPTYLVQINQSPPVIATDAVRTAQLTTTMTTPYSAFTKLVEVDDIADHIDQHHMKASTQNALGNRIARRHLRIAE